MMMDSPRDHDDEASLDIVCADSEDNILLNNGDSFGCLSDEDVDVVQPPRGRMIEAKSSDLVDSLRIIAKSSPRMADMILQNTETLDRRLSEIMKSESNAIHRTPSGTYSGLNFADSRDDNTRTPIVTVVDYPTNDMVEVFGPLGDDTSDDECDRDKDKDSIGEDHDATAQVVRSASSQLPKVTTPASQANSGTAKSVASSQFPEVTTPASQAKSETARSVASAPCRFNTQKTMFEINTHESLVANAPSPPASPDVFGPPRRLHAEKKLNDRLHEKLHTPVNNGETTDDDDDDTEDEGSLDLGLVGPPRAISYDRLGKPNSKEAGRNCDLPGNDADDAAEEDAAEDDDAEDDDAEYDDAEDDGNRDVESEFEENSSDGSEDEYLPGNEMEETTILQKNPSSLDENRPIQVSKPQFPVVSPNVPPYDAPTFVASEPEKEFRDVALSEDDDKDGELASRKVESSTKRNILRRMFRADKRNKTGSRQVGNEVERTLEKSTALQAVDRLDARQNVDQPLVCKSDDIKMEEVDNLDDDEEATDAGQKEAQKHTSKGFAAVVGRSLTPLKSRIAAQSRRHVQQPHDEEEVNHDEIVESEQVETRQPARSTFMSSMGRSFTPLKARIASSSRKVRQTKPSNACTEVNNGGLDCSCLPVSNEPIDENEDLRENDPDDMKMHETSDSKSFGDVATLAKDHPMNKKSSRPSRRVISLVGKKLPSKRAKKVESAVAADVSHDQSENEGVLSFEKYRCAPSESLTDSASSFKRTLPDQNVDNLATNQNNTDRKAPNISSKRKKSRQLVNLIGRTISPKKALITKKSAGNGVGETANDAPDNLETACACEELEDAVDRNINLSPKKGLLSRAKRALSPSKARTTVPSTLPEINDSMRSSIIAVESRLLSVNSSEIETTVVIEPKELEQVQTADEEEQKPGTQDSVSHVENFGFLHRVVRGISPPKARNNNTNDTTSTLHGLDSAVATVNTTKVAAGNAFPSTKEGRLSRARHAFVPSKKITGVPHQSSEINMSTHSISGVDSTLFSVKSSEIETTVVIESTELDGNQGNGKEQQEESVNESPGLLRLALRAISPPKRRNNTSAEDSERKSKEVNFPEESDQSETAHGNQSSLGKFFRSVARTVSPGKLRANEDTIEKSLKSDCSIGGAPSNGEQSPIVVIDSCEDTSVRFVASSDSKSQDIDQNSVHDTVASTSPITQGETTMSGESLVPSVFDSFANSFSYVMSALQPAECFPLVRATVSQVCSVKENSEGMSSDRNLASKEAEKQVVDDFHVVPMAQDEQSSDSSIQKHEDKAPEMTESVRLNTIQDTEGNATPHGSKSMTSQPNRKVVSKTDRNWAQSKLQKTVDIRAYSTEIEAKVPSPKVSFLNRRINPRTKSGETDQSSRQKVAIIATEVETTTKKTKPGFLSLRFKSRNGDKILHKEATEADELVCRLNESPDTNKAGHGSTCVIACEEDSSVPVASPQSIKRKVDIHAEDTEIETSKACGFTPLSRPTLENSTDAPEIPSLKPREKTVNIQSKSKEIEAKASDPTARFFGRHKFDSVDKQQKKKNQRDIAVVDGSERPDYDSGLPDNERGILQEKLKHDVDAIAYPVTNRLYRKIDLSQEKPAVGPEQDKTVEICASSPMDTVDSESAGANETLEQNDTASSQQEDADIKEHEDDHGPKPAESKGLKPEPRIGGLFNLGKVFGRKKAQTSASTTATSMTAKVLDNQIVVSPSYEPCPSKSTLLGDETVQPDAKPDENASNAKWTETNQNDASVDTDQTSEKCSFDQSFGPKEAEDKVEESKSAMQDVTSMPYVTIVPAELDEVPVQHDVDRTHEEKAQSISHDITDRSTSHTAKARKLLSDKNVRPRKHSKRSPLSSKNISKESDMGKGDDNTADAPLPQTNASDVDCNDHSQVCVPAVSAENIPTGLTPKPKVPLAKTEGKGPRHKAQRLAERRKKRIAKLVGEEENSTAGFSEAGNRPVSGHWWRRGPVTPESPSNASVGTKEYDKHMGVCAVSDEVVAPDENHKVTERNRALTGGKPPLPQKLPMASKHQEKETKVQQRDDKVHNAKKQMHREDADDVVSSADQTFNDNLSDIFAPPVVRAQGWLW